MEQIKFVPSREFQMSISWAISGRTFYTQCTAPSCAVLLEERSKEQRKRSSRHDNITLFQALVSSLGPADKK
jgi:hypothetical protein